VLIVRGDPTKSVAFRLGGNFGEHCRRHIADGQRCEGRRGDRSVESTGGIQLVMSHHVMINYIYAQTSNSLRNARPSPVVEPPVVANDHALADSEEIQDWNSECLACRLATYDETDRHPGAFDNILLNVDLGVGDRVEDATVGPLNISLATRRTEVRGSDDCI